MSAPGFESVLRGLRLLSELGFVNPGNEEGRLSIEPGLSLLWSRDERSNAHPRLVNVLDDALDPTPKREFVPLFE